MRVLSVKLSNYRDVDLSRCRQIERLTVRHIDLSNYRDSVLSSERLNYLRYMRAKSLSMSYSFGLPPYKGKPAEARLE